MDIGAAFTYMFDDGAWLKKLAIGGVAMLLGIIFVPLLIINGYTLQTLKYVRDYQPAPLPEWDDLAGLTRKGFVVFLIGLVYSLPAFFPLCLLTALIIATPEANPDMANTFWLAWVCLISLFSILIFVAGVLFPAALIRYAQFDTIGAAFQLREIFRFIFANLGDYTIVVLLGIVAGMVAQFGLLLCGIGFFFTSFWSALVMAHLYGQLARRSALPSPV